MTDTVTTPAPHDRLTAQLAPIHDRAQMTARRLCRSDADGDDLFQDAALRALQRLGELRDDQAFGAWFYRVLVSVHRTRARRAFWRRLLPLDVAAPGGDIAGADGAADADARAGVQRLRRALARLPVRQREAVVLFDLDGCTLREIADIQGASLSAVKSRLARGRERLRAFYSDHARDRGSSPEVSERRGAPTPSVRLADTDHDARPTARPNTRPSARRDLPAREPLERGNPS